MATCEYIGPEQKEWPYTMCGAHAVPGKSYCVHHYPVVYSVGSSVNRKKANAAALEGELAKLMAEQAEEQENEHV
jgi:hypothetical protein